MNVSITPLIQAMQAHLECDVTFDEEKYLTLKIEELASIPKGLIPIEKWMKHIDEYWSSIVNEPGDSDYREALLISAGFTPHGAKEAMKRYYWQVPVNVFKP